MGLFSIFGKSNVVYFPGCYTYFRFKEHFELYQKIFSKLGIDFNVVEKKICCGLPAFEAGYDNETRKIARRNFEIFKEAGIKQIITNSPCCYKMLLDYNKFLPDWNISVLNLWQIILEKIETKPSLIRSSGKGVVFYQDSCYLGRYCNIYDEPRKILKLIGYDLKEIPDSREKSICCGSCGGLTIVNPKLADKAARERLMQIKRAGINRVVVSSFKEYELLKKNSKELGMEIFELGEVIGLALGLRMPKETEEESDDESDEEKILEETQANMDFAEELEEDESENKKEKELDDE